MNGTQEAAAAIHELEIFLNGVNTAAGIRTPAAGSRSLNMDDVHYYIFNRRRVLQGLPALSPEKWFEAVR